MDNDTQELIAIQEELERLGDRFTTLFSVGYVGLIVKSSYVACVNTG